MDALIAGLIVWLLRRRPVANAIEAAVETETWRHDPRALELLWKVDRPVMRVVISGSPILLPLHWQSAQSSIREH